MSAEKKTATESSGNYLLVFFFAVMLIGAAIILIPVYRNYRRQQAKLFELQQENKMLREELFLRTAEVDALSSSPAAVEKVAREKFKLVKDGERVINYETPGKR